YASAPTVIPGYLALPFSEAAKGTPLRIKLRSQRYAGSHPWEQPSGEVGYSIVTPPKHGVLGPLSGSEVTYTPTGNYAGPDSFTFSARDAKSGYPLSPPAAAVSIVGLTPTISISGAQAEQVVGTSAQLTALVGNDTGGVEWQASAGTLSVQGLEGQLGLYQAPAQPPPGGTVTITAWLRDDPEVSAQQTIRIVL